MPETPRCVLPQPRRQDVLSLTAGGQRLRFTTVAQLLRSPRRNDPIVAVCLDNCAWRRFDEFRHGMWEGLSALEAFDRSGFYLGEQTVPTAPRRVA